MLKPVVAMKGSLTIDQLDDDSLADFVQDRREQGCKASTINRTLAVVRAICNRSATVWKFENGLTWLDRAPKITLLGEDDKRPPRPLAWSEQPALLDQLPSHLAVMTLFDLNCGVRDDVVCSLRWNWEARVQLQKDLMISVFVVPCDHVKGHKQERILICNSVAQRLVDEQRGRHPEYVFTYPRPKGRGRVERTASAAHEQHRLAEGSRPYWAGRPTRSRFAAHRRHAAAQHGREPPHPGRDPLACLGGDD